MKTAAKRRWSAFGGIAFLLVVLAVGLLQGRREPPLLRIGDITPRHNFSIARIQGALDHDPIKLRDGGVLLSVNDGTGTLAVFVESNPDGVSARRGALVSAEGDLFIGAGANRRMRVLSAADVTISGGSRAAGWAERSGELVTARGTVARVWRAPTGSKAPSRIRLVADVGAIDVVHWLDGVPVFEPGDAVEVTGVVNLYENEVRIKLTSPANARLLN